METGPSTNLNGILFSPSVVISIWNMATPIAGLSLTEFRCDACGRKIEFCKFGLNGLFGWEIGYRVSPCDGGTDDPSNLIALHWKNWDAETQSACNADMLLTEYSA